MIPRIFGSSLAAVIVLMVGAESTLGASPQVVTSTPTVREIVKLVSGSNIDVVSLAVGGQDPHFLEAKPSYLVKLRDAKAVFAIGLELEIGWLPPLIKNSRNPELQGSQAKYFEIGEWIKALEVPTGSVDRAQGDVHSKGNPHFYLDPVLVLEILPKLEGVLISLFPAQTAEFKKQTQASVAELRDRITKWQKRLSALKGKGVVTHHKTLSYFLNRFTLKLVDTIEPKPGIPPTAKHIAMLEAQAVSQNFSCILLESFFDDISAKRLKEKAKINYRIVATEVEALPGVASYFDLVENLVKSAEECVK